MVINKISLVNVIMPLALLTILTACSTPHNTQNELYNKERTSNITPEQVEILSTLGDAKIGEIKSNDNGLSLKVVEHYISAMGANCRKLNIMGKSTDDKNSLICVDYGQIYFIPTIYENTNIGSAL